ncbi:hypothetical protein M2138_000310 [Dysgonomonadaceae bacterium PH5-43]|nr:hypothetical protein [Dysgonomonadaceae bacterium PH5-43]
MKIKLLLVFSLFGVFVTNIYGQDSLAYKSKWQIRVLAGVNLPITKISQGAETDNLIQFDNSSFYLQPVSISYFFSKHWGAEFSAQGSISRKSRNRSDRFTNDMQTQYGEMFYVRANSTGSPDSDLFLSDIFSEMCLLGVIYRLETDKYYVYPKFSMGLTSFAIDSGDVNLKEKNSNNEFRVCYSGEGKLLKEYFTLAPSVSFGYKISNRFFLNADIMFSYYHSNFVYNKETKNLFTNEKTVETFGYKKGISTLSLGLGFIFVLK